MAPANRERVAWYEQTLAIRSKNAVLITDINFTDPLLEETAKSYTLMLTARIEILGLTSLLPTKGDQFSLTPKVMDVECYLFNHRHADGSFFEMRLKYAPINVSGTGPPGGYHFVAPWQEVIDSGAIRAGSHVQVYGYKEEGRIVLVLRRFDSDDDYMDADAITVSGEKMGNWAVFKLSWNSDILTQIRPAHEIVEMTFC